nr:MAG TPA: hypothetical protein [Caudoviricetes sp.]
MDWFEELWNDDSWNKLCRQYMRNDVDATYDCYIKWLDKSTSANKETTERSNCMPTDIRRLIKNVKFNPPATIVFWTDNTKTVVKCNGEDYDPEKGLAMCICKKMLGNKGNYYEVFKKWLPKRDDSDATQKVLQHIEPKAFKFKLGLDNFNEQLFKTFTGSSENTIKFEETKEKTECPCYTCRFYDKDEGCMNKKSCFNFDKWAHKDE